MNVVDLLDRIQKNNECAISLQLVGQLNAYLAESGSGLIRWQRYFAFPPTWEETSTRETLQRFLEAGVSVHDVVHEDGFLREIAEWLLDFGLLNIQFQIGAESLQIKPRRVPADPPERLLCADNLKLSKFLILNELDENCEISLPHSWCDLRGEGVLQLITWLRTTAIGQLPQDIKYMLIWVGILEPQINGTDLKSEMWSPHELWFYERSTRFGRSRRFGGSFWGREKYSPPDGVELRAVLQQKLCTSFAPISLPVVQSFSYRGHSVRKFAGAPICLQTFTEFLARAVGLKSETLVDGYRYKSKEYPSGGAAYEHQIFIIARNVDSLEPGLYWFDDGTNRLNKVVGIDQIGVNSLWNQYKYSIGGGEPAAAVVAVADFARIFWKYEQMAYSLVLKNTGSLLSTLYVSAKDCGLGCCAVGSGDGELLLGALGLDPMRFGVVGELVVGVET